MQDKCFYVLIKERYHKQEVILKMYFQFSYDFREENNGLQLSMEFKNGKCSYCFSF